MVTVILNGLSSNADVRATTIPHLKILMLGRIDVDDVVIEVVGSIDLIDFVDHDTTCIELRVT